MVFKNVRLTGDDIRLVSAMRMRGRAFRRMFKGGYSKTFENAPRFMIDMFRLYICRLDRFNPNEWLAAPRRDRVVEGELGRITRPQDHHIDTKSIIMCS